MIYKLLQIFTIFILLLFPFGEILRFDLGNNVIFKPLDFAVGITALVWLISAVITRKKFTYHWQLLFFPLAALFSLLINSTWLKPNELMVSAFYLIRWISYVMLIPVFESFSSSFKKKIYAILFIDGFIMTILGYLQYFFYPNLKNLYYLGWDDHLYRMFSVFLDPNFAGAFFVFYLLFIVGLTNDYQNKSHSGKRSASRMAIRIFLYLILFIVLGAIFLTFSRSALLMFLSTAIVFLTLIKRKKLLFILFGIVLAAILIISPWFYLENVNLFRINSGKARIEVSIHALQIIHDNPIFGVGFDTYRYAQIKYGFIKSNPIYQAHSASGVENSFLFVLATTGIVGVIGFLTFWYYWLGKAWVLYKKTSITTAVVVFSSIVGLFIDSFFINSLFFPDLLLWLFILIGIMEQKFI